MYGMRCRRIFEVMPWFVVRMTMSLLIAISDVSETGVPDGWMLTFAVRVCAYASFVYVV